VSGGGPSAAVGRGGGTSKAGASLALSSGSRRRLRSDDRILPLRELSAPAPSETKAPPSSLPTLTEWGEHTVAAMTAALKYLLGIDKTVMQAAGKPDGHANEGGLVSRARPSNANTLTSSHARRSPVLMRASRYLDRRRVPDRRTCCRIAIQRRTGGHVVRRKERAAAKRRQRSRRWLRAAAVSLGPTRRLGVAALERNPGQGARLVRYLRTLHA
jgi:hypothetical protein